MCDLYVEDLNSTRKIIEDMDINFYLYNGEAEPIKIDKKEKLSNKELNILKKFNRNINNSNCYNNRSWNILVCSGNFDIIRVTVDNETINLSCIIP